MHSNRHPPTLVTLRDDSIGHSVIFYKAEKHMPTTTWYCTTCGAANESLNTQCFACAQPYVENATEIASLDMLLGRYRLLTQVGVGGFGVVYKAIDTQRSDHIVAIKQINLRGLSPQKMIEATDAFNREVQHLTPLQHPNLPRIFDHFTDPDHWYLVMEFIAGETLERYLETRRSQHAYSGNRTFLPLEEIFPLACQLCDVLTYLHTRHPPIIFRDIKPANIMRTAKGHLYLIDFGIARHFKPGQDRDTTPLGSPGYAAPEQYGKAQTTPRADLYSLGALLHYLLTGEDPAETLFQFAPLPQAAGSEMQMQKLDTLIRRMVHVDSEQRPVSASAVKEELQSIARLATDSAPRIWYPPEGQTPSPSLIHATLTQESARQLQLQAQQQKAKGTSRRKFIIRSLAGGTVVIVGTTIVGSALINRFASFGLHREVFSSYAYPTTSSSIPDQQATNFPAQSQQTSNPAIAWSPDGKQAAFVSPDASFVEVYSIASTGVLTYLTKLQDKYFPAPISTLSWSPDGPDGSRIATGTTDTGIDIWFITGSPGPMNSFPLNYPSSSGPLDMLAWSPDSNLLAISGPRKPLQICVSQTGKTIFQQSTPNNRIRFLSWSPDSNRIVIEKDLPDLNSAVHSLEVWNIAAGKPIFSFATLSGLNMVKASWSPDGTTIATLGNNRQLYLWNAADGSPITTHFITEDNYIDLIWSPDSKSIALEIANGNLRVWHRQSNLSDYHTIHATARRTWLWLQDGRIALIDATKTVQYFTTADTH